ncbi:MAG TPA: ferritin-like domain-containing protein [Gaiellaceae bacterium]|nr:ferritin-like domain-containing protein [Gaiellaceae bacterium]
MLDDMLNRTKVSTPQELFVHNLGAALTMEETVEEMLEKLSEEANDAELRRLLRHHHEETEAQIRNLRQAFQAIGEEPDTKPCPAIEGIEKEGETNLKLADDALADDVILAGCAETEHHEIAVYENLIVAADAMGQEDVVALLRENLEQEQHTLGEVLKSSVRHAQQRTGTAR